MLQGLASYCRACKKEQEVYPDGGEHRFAKHPFGKRKQPCPNSDQPATGPVVNLAIVHITG